MKRWFWPLAVLIVLAAAGIGRYRQRPVEVRLPVFNHSQQAVQLLFYGAGMQDQVLVTELAPEHGTEITLTLSGVGPIRVKAESERARIDAELARSNTQLREQPLRFEVRPGNQFVLVPR